MTQFTNFEQVIEASNQAENEFEIAQWVVGAAQERGTLSVEDCETDLDYLAEQGGMQGVDYALLVEKIEQLLAE